MDVKYKDHEITYRENSNTWFCAETGDHSSLVAAKKAIDDMLRKGRRADIKALFLSGSSWRSDDDVYYEVNVGAMVEPRHSSGEITEAWITYNNKRGKAEREKVSISRLYPLEMREQLEKYIVLKNVAKKAERSAETFKEGLIGYNATRIKAAKGGDSK